MQRTKIVRIFFLPWFGQQAVSAVLLEKGKKI